MGRTGPKAWNYWKQMFTNFTDREHFRESNIKTDVMKIGFVVGTPCMASAFGTKLRPMLKVFQSFDKFCSFRHRGLMSNALSKLTLKMTTTLFAETLENPRYSIRPSPEILYRMEKQISVQFSVEEKVGNL